MCRSGLPHRSKGRWRCVFGPQWKPALEHSWGRSRNNWSAGGSRTAPLISAAPPTRRLGTPRSCQAGCGSPAPKTDKLRYNTKVLKIKRVYFLFHLIIFLQRCHKANSKATNQLFIGCLEDHSGVPAGQGATAESVGCLTQIWTTWIVHGFICVSE